jgi:pSer/pThr/pTyr-binding forkhead associated (FHA) protein
VSTTISGLQFPALHQAVGVGGGRRVARGLLSVVLVGVLAAGIALGARALLAPGAGWEWLVGAGLLAATALALPIWLWGGLGGRWLPDLALGTRTVSFEDAGRPGVSGLLRGALMVLLGLPTAGVAPLVLCLVARDDQGRCWQDRLTGLVSIDVRRGRDVHAQPVNATELDALVHRPVVRPAIIEVNPGSPAGAAGPWQRPEPVRQPAWQPPSAPPPTAPRAPYRAPAAPAGYAEGATRIAAAPAPPPPPAATAWTLSFDTGQTHLLREAAILGRAPVAQAGYRSADLVRVEDSSQTVSSTHLAVRGNEVGVWVEDLGSTNGSEIVTPAGRAKALSPHSPIAVPAGGRVRLGDRWFTVGGGQR